MTDLLIASMPGTMASSGLDGSFLLPLIRDVLSNEFVNQLDEVKVLNRRVPELGQVRKFVRDNNDLDSSLILSGKSLGGVKVAVKVLLQDWQNYDYHKVGLFTVDPWGLGYGWDRITGEDEIKLPAGLINREDGWGFLGHNLYQRNSFLQGAKVRGAKNFYLKGEDVKHNNIVFHPRVREQMVEMIGWALNED